ncbi:MAG: Na/Pi cotransporter family protein [Bacteroidota bacterium]
MNFLPWELFQIVGALCFFIYGMKIMSFGIQRAAGSQLRNILRTVTKNRFIGVVTGFLTTAIVQSSSATTVMTVSFVNAGLITLVESAGIMMGANIGTTITGWIVSILGFTVKLSNYSIPIFAVAVPLSFLKISKLKYWGEFLIGFAMLFLGLYHMEQAIPDISKNEEFLSFIKSFSEYGILSRLFFVIIGAVITIIVQSSSAAMAITLTLVYKGWLPLDIACAMALGENVGTTVTAEVASLIGNTQAKRSARIHSLFNLIGVSWMIVALPFVLGWLTSFVTNSTYLFDGFVAVQENLSNQDRISTYTLAAFHTLFNILNVILLIGFVPWLVKLAERTVSGEPEDDETTRLRYIGSNNITPEISILEAQKEVARFGHITSRMSSFAQDLLLDPSKSDSNRRRLLNKIEKYEAITDRFEIELAEYLTNVAKQELTPEMSVRIRSILNIGNEMERIGDDFYQISKTIERKFEEKIWFTQHQRERLKEMFTLVDEAFDAMIKNLEHPHYENVRKERSVLLEQKINTQRDIMRKENTIAMEMDEEYNINSAMIYNNIFSNLEKVGDHVINITEAVVGEI